MGVKSEIWNILSSVKRILKIMLGRNNSVPPKLTMVDAWRQNGAIIGDNVDLVECECNYYDATTVEIGNNVTLVYTRILTHDASLRKFIGNDCNKIGRVVIGNNVFVGYRSIILPNVKIGNNVIIGAGSVVTHDIPSNSVAVGNPAHVICSCDNYIKKHLARMQDAENVYWDISRSKMTPEEREVFNKRIDGKIIYMKSSSQPEITYSPCQERGRTK